MGDEIKLVVPKPVLTVATVYRSRIYGDNKI